MADVTIKVSSTNDPTGSKAAAEGIERIGDEAVKAVPKLTGLEGQSRRTGREADQMGDQFDGASRDAQKLVGRLLVLSETTKDLGRQFASTGKMEFLKEFQKQTAELNKTRRVAKALDIDDPTSPKKVIESVTKTAKEGASTFASVFQGGIIETFKGLPSEAKLALGASAVAMGIALAGPLITTVNSLLLAGIGGGALAAGIALASQDPAVQTAFNKLGGKVSERLAESARPFRQELIESAEVFDEAFTRVAPRIDATFAGLAQEVKPLSEGLAQAGENMLPGLERAVAASRPLIRDLAKWLPELGESAGDLFDALAEAGPGLQMAFKFVLGWVTTLIKAFELMTRAVSPAFNTIAKIGDMLGLWDIGPVEETTDALSKTSSAASDASGSFSSLSREAYNTADAANQINREFDELFEQYMSVDEANLRVAEGLVKLKEELADGARTLDINTEAGQANTRSVLDQLDALNAKREADIRAGNGTKEATETANAAYAAQVEAIRRMLLQLGFAKESVDALIQKYLDLDGTTASTFINTYHHDYYASSSRKFDSPEQRQGRKLATGGIIGAEVGGPRSGLMRIGEDIAEAGWEYARLPTGSMVYSHANSAQMDAMAAQSGGGSSGGMAIELRVNGGANDVTELLQYWLRTGKLQAFAKAS